jgi:ABC-type sugar transport system ATPase subunit
VITADIRSERPRPSALNRAKIARLHAIVRRLADQGKAILYVSHHLDEVFDLCDEVAVLRNGSLVHQSETSELDEQELVEHMLGRKPQTLERANGETTSMNEARLVVDGLRIGGFDEPFSLTVRPGEIVGLAGLVGSGR